MLCSAAVARAVTDNAFFSCSPIASKELVSEFNKLLADDSLFGLLVTIHSEALQPMTTLPSTSTDFAQNLSQLAPHLQPNEALYILLKRHPDAPRLIAVSYVPDSAKVRQKMLFASTRLTLVRELGSEHFRETIFATTPEELGAQGFAKHDRHAELEAPLTEEERTLGEVKRAEAEAGAGTGQREIHLSKNMNMPVATDALVALSDMGREQGRGIVMLVCQDAQSYTTTTIILGTSQLIAHSVLLRKSTLKARSSNSSPSPATPLPSQTSCRPSRLRSRASPSGATSTRIRAPRATPSSSSTRAPRRPVSPSSSA